MEPDYERILSCSADESTAIMFYSSTNQKTAVPPNTVVGDVEKEGGYDGGGNEEPPKLRYKIPSADDKSSDEVENESLTSGSKFNWVKDELKETLKLACPMTLSFIFGLLTSTVSMIFCGHLGTTDLAALGLATSFVNITGYAVGSGLASACDTLFSQTYGSGNKKNVGIHLQKSLMIMFLYSFPVMAIVMNSEQLFNLLGQGTVISKLAGDYLMIYLPGIIGTFMYLVLTKYLMNQNIVTPLIVIGIFSNIINAILQYVLVLVYEMGIRGSAASVTITYCCMPIFIVIYVVASGVYKETWPGWSKESLFDWWTFNCYAIPGMFMVILEWSAFEISIFVAGWLGEIDLSGQSIIYQIAVYAYYIFYGVSVAGGVRVGQHLGAGNTRGAARASRVAGIIAVMLSVTTTAILFSMNSILPEIFTSDQEVIELSSWLLKLVAAYQFINCFGIVYSGILRGCGWQNVGAVTFFVSFYCISFPIGIPLMVLTPLRVSGYWYGQIVGESVCSALFLFLVFRMNWEKESEKTSKRIQIEAATKEDGNGDEESTPLLGGDKSATLTSGILCKRLVFVLVASSVMVAGSLTKILLPEPANFYPCSGNSTIIMNCTSNMM